MLEQRRAKEKGYITLKEAAEIANYTPDYVGQLIRAGKIKGEQVYANVAWVTTEEEIEAYLTNKKRAAIQSGSSYEALVAQFGTWILYIVIALCALAILVLQYIFYISLDTELNQKYLSEYQQPAVTVPEVATNR